MSIFTTIVLMLTIVSVFLAVMFKYIELSSKEGAIVVAPEWAITVITLWVGICAAHMLHQLVSYWG